VGLSSGFVAQLSKYYIGSKLMSFTLENLPGLLPLEIVLENSKALAFRNPNKKNNSFIIIPKKHIPNLTTMSENDYDYIIESFKLVKQAIKKYNTNNSDYSVNIDSKANEELEQVHINLQF
jgi:diadenosine tetraphosphate (Ap4A) HIT family hydrolase